MTSRVPGEAAEPPRVGAGRGTEPVPADGVNWDAYTHEELYQMLWQDADVADVGAIAEEWRRHSSALAEHAVRLREQQAALGENWQGEAAELAATRLGELADRIDAISARAAAAQQAGDALALARSMLPPPSGVPGGTAPATQPMSTAQPVSTAQPTPFALPTVPATPFALPTVPTAQSTPFALPTVPTVPTAPSAATGTGGGGGFGWYFVIGAPPSSTTSATGMGSAFGALATAGTSMYATDAAASQAKAQAVHAMRVYESSLRGGGQLIAAPGAATARTYGVDRPPVGVDRLPATTGLPAASGLPGRGGAWFPADSARGGGVPWDRLVGRGQQPPGPGGSVGTRVPAGVPTAHGTPAAVEPAAGRATNPGGGVVPPVGQRGTTSDDELHHNRMPVMDHGLFTVDTRTAGPVIGAHPTEVDQ